jgi:hypothetical protein
MSTIIRPQTVTRLKSAKWGAREKNGAQSAELRMANKKENIE